MPRPFGAANWVTSVRAGFGVFLFAGGALAAGQGAMPSPPLRWTVVLGALIALVLDGVDGALARRLGQESPFGARFDMETDAAIVLGLSLWVAACGQAGAWVLVSGALRYIFIGGGWLWPALAAPLPQRRRRQAVCVVQVAALIVASAPLVPAAPAGLICAAALALLAGSFAIDIAWLLANRIDAVTARS